MNVRTRLLLFGAALPTVTLVTTMLLAGQAFRLRLLRALDHALLAQAAVESVSLFDGPTGRPHVHLTRSPLAKEVRSFVSTAALFEPGGEIVARYPENLPPLEPPSTDEVGAAGEPARLSTRPGHDGHLQRELAVRVRAPWGQDYTLKLASSLTEIDSTLRDYYRAALGVCAAAALLLLTVQGFHASRMSRRLREMATYLPQLKEGDLTWRLSPDPTGDEIAALRAALQEAMERLRTAREAQERLIANAAHELKTPLGLMRTEMDLALRKQRSAAELRDALAEARREVDRLTALAARLLDLAALGAVSWAPARGDLAELVREAVEGHESEAARRGVRLDVDLPSEAPAVFEAQTLWQALDNYLANALRFAPEGSTVTVGLRRQEGHYRVEVRDQGPGVALGEEARIFEPFYRGEGQAGDGGAGLGLAIVQEIARKHGGQAYVAPRGEGRGATFVLELPPEPSPGPTWQRRMAQSAGEPRA